MAGSSPPAVIRPAVLRWARESAGYPIDRAAQRIGVGASKLLAAEEGEHQLTMRQAEKAAQVYDRPLSALFVPDPPVEEPAEAQFRRLAGAPPPPWPPEMRLLVRRVRARQDATVEILDLLEEEPLWPSARPPLFENAERAAEAARDALAVDVNEQWSWRDSQGYVPLRHWVEAVEALGILVMQDGTVRLDTMRGFASIHPSVPAIVMQTDDAPRARVFTLLHELGHLLRAARDSDESRNRVERWCNTFAASVLMPVEDFRNDFKRAVSHAAPLDAVREVALSYGVTNYATALRVADLRLLPQEEISHIRAVFAARATRAEAAEDASRGGNYYRTTVSRLSPSFVHLVFEALDTQALSYVDAAGLLGVKINHFEPLRERAAERVRAVS